MERDFFADDAEDFLAAEDAEPRFVPDDMMMSTIMMAGRDGREGDLLMLLLETQITVDRR
jgi:hypothetical protein